MLKYRSIPKKQIFEEDHLLIDDSKFSELINKDLQKIIDILMDEGYIVRIVGGAVRDILLGLEPRDIDLVTDAKPIEIIFLFSEKNLGMDVKGVAHGTVKIILNDIKYELTSADFKIKRIPGSKLKIGSGIVDANIWRRDAIRRDFTVNSLSMDLTGKVYDYTGGVKDLENQMIKPLGDFQHKIFETPILVLRFFKLLAKFPEAKFSRHTIDIVKDNIRFLSFIDDERFNREIINIKNSPNGERTLDFMRKLKALND